MQRNHGRTENAEMKRGVGDVLKTDSRFSESPNFFTTRFLLFCSVISVSTVVEHPSENFPELRWIFLEPRTKPLKP